MNPGNLTAASVFLLSGAAVAYQVILVRLLAMTRFHHLVFIILSLALLGYGASGAVLAWGRARFLDGFRSWFSAFSAVFAAGAVLCFQLSQRIPVFPGQWIWSPLEALNLAGLYLILSFPFLAAACGVGLAYCSLENAPGGIYRADLLGAAAGSLGGLAVLWLPEGQGLWLPWAGGFAAAVLSALPDRRRLAAACCILAAAGPLAGPKGAVRLVPSPDKPLSVALSGDGAEMLADVYSPLGRITVTRNRLAPYRHAPGLSLAFRGLVGAQWGAFTDGESFAPLFPEPAAAEARAHLEYLPEALAWRLAPRPRVLVLDAPGMESLSRAAAHGARMVDLVVENPGWRDLLGEESASGEGRVLLPPNVRLIIGAPRGLLRETHRRYDLIVIGPPGGSPLTADHLHTAEAFREAIGRLDSDGLLAVSGPSDLPPRAGLRLLSTAAAALRMSGVHRPEAHMAMIRSLQTVHLIVANRPFTSADTDGIRAFCSERMFDPVWFPGMDPGEANRWNRMAGPEFHEGARTLLGPDSDSFLRRYKFDVSTVTDDRPYFSRYIKPGTLGELISRRAGGGLGLLSHAEPVLAVTLGQAVLLCLAVVWLPLRRFRPPEKAAGRGAAYVLLGAGFMLAEFAVMEKMSRFLSAPVIGVAVTLATFLAAAGLGGGLSSRLAAKGRDPRQWAGIAAAGVSGLIMLYLASLPSLLGALAGHPLPVRILLAVLSISPLALVMGAPFPLALADLRETGARSVPWAWGLNGCGSVIGPVAGISLAVYGGVSVVLAAAALCYLAVFALLRGRPNGGKSL